MAIAVGDIPLRSHRTNSPPTTAAAALAMATCSWVESTDRTAIEVFGGLTETETVPALVELLPDHLLKSSYASILAAVCEGLKSANEEVSVSPTRFFRSRLERSDVKTVLFVCVENTFRSVLAEELFNSKAPPGWHAESAGVSPASAVNPAVRDLLLELGIVMKERTPRLSTPDLVARASKVVTFGCLDRCPIGAKEKGEDWPLPGASGKTMEELRAIRDDLNTRIAGLVSRIMKTEQTTIA